MWLSPFRSNTRALAALAGLAGLAGCPGDDSECGPAAGTSSSLAASSADANLVYENLTSLAGNDCPDPAAPAGVVSISIEGRQTGGALGLVTFCIPRPDLLTSGPRTLGTSQSMADVRIFDMSGEYNSCTFTFDSTRPPTGQVRGLGVCGNGDDAAGFALELDAAVSLRRTCDTTIDSVGVTLVGLVAIAKRS